MDIAEPVNRLIEQFKKLPGIGTKSAQRLAFFVLKMETARCERTCRNHTRGQAVDSPLLGLQQSHRRRSLSVLHAPVAIRQGAVRCRGIEQHSAGRKNAHLQRPLSRADGVAVAAEGRDARSTGHPFPSPTTSVGSVEEVIVATNPNVEGETTALYLSRLIKPLGIRVTRLRWAFLSAAIWSTPTKSRWPRLSRAGESFREKKDR